MQFQGPEEPKVLLKILADSADQQDWCLVSPSRSLVQPPGQPQLWPVASVLGGPARARGEGAKASPLYVEMQVRLSHDLDLTVPAQKDLQAGSE